MNRQIITSVLAAMLCITITACGGSKREASEKALSVGKQALETTDAYLGGDLSYNRAKDSIDGLYHEMDYVSEQEYNEEHHVADALIRTHISGISINLISDNFNKDSASYKKLLEARNDLAEDIGEKKK